MTNQRPAGAKDKLRSHFLANLGKVMDSKELREVANNTAEYARRIRELRNEEGYQILTHNDRSSLKPGEYLLESAKPEPAFARDVSKEVRAFVLDRNGNTCQMCGAAAGEPSPYNEKRKVRLQIGHIIDKSKGGPDHPSNLRALCSDCNEGAQNITPMKPDLKKLLIEIRRAKSDDVLEVLKLLIKRFPLQAKEYVGQQ